MKIVFYLIVFILLFIAYVRYVEYRTLFIPSKTIEATPKDIELDYENIFFPTQDGLQLNAWLIKAPQAKGTLIFFHGNAGNISHRLEKIQMFHQMGCNVFIVDYRGYGRSEGHPTEKGMYSDALGAFDYLKTREDLDPKGLIAYGASLGGAAAVDLASKRPCAALIIDSSFSSAKDMAKVILPFVPSFLIGVQLDSATKIQNVTIPKLFLHSLEDEVVPFALGKKLYDHAPEPKQFVQIAGGHNDNHLFDQNSYVRGVITFLQQWDLIP